MLKAIFHVSFALACVFVLLPCVGDAQVTPGVLQSAAQTATISGSVLSSDGTPVAGANVRLTGPGAHLKTVSDEHGAFIFVSVPYGTYRVDVNAAKLGAVSRNEIVVKGDITLAIQFIPQSSNGLKTIANVSTHNAGISINVTPASIASVNPSDFAFQGNTSWRQLLSQIPGVTAGGSLCEGRTPAAIPNSPLYPVVLSINGAQPYETSVTLDGMPLTSQSVTAQVGGGIDLSYLSMLPFGTADVVRGPGADAPSIVNSIGGSFVLHAPSSVEKDAYEVSLSNDPYGGTVANAKIALRLGRLSARIAYGMNNSPGPFEGTMAPVLTNVVPVTIATQPVRSFPGTSSGAFEESASLLASGGYQSSAWKQHNGAISLSYAIAPSITAEVFYVGTSATQAVEDNIIPWNFVPGPGYSGSLLPGAYKLQFSSNPFYDNQSASLLEEKVTAYVGGGVLRLAALQNNSFVHYLYGSEANGTYTLYGTACVGTAPANSSCASGGTLTPYNGTAENLTFSPLADYVYQWSHNRDLLASFARQVGSKSNFSISFVTSYYDDPELITLLEPGTLFLSTAQADAVSDTTNELRFQGATQISDALSLTASWYFARSTYHVPDPYVSNCVFSIPSAVPGYAFSIVTSQPSAYQDSIFSYNAPRLGATWRVNRNTVIRGAAGGGFALPPLADLLGSSGTPTCSTSTGYCTVSLTNLNLQPEKSFGFDLGTDVRLHHDTVFSFDLYRADLYGQLFNSIEQNGTCSAVPGCPSGDGNLLLYTSQMGNLSHSRMEGITVNLRHDVPRGIYWSGAFGLTRGYVVSVPAGFYEKTAGVPCNSAATCQNQYIIPGVNFNGYFQNGAGSAVPYANGGATIGYRWAPGKYVDLSPTYYGNNNAYNRPAFLELDAHAGYALTKNVSLEAIFQNITGIYDGTQNMIFGPPYITAPVIAGAPQEKYALYGIQYGPRSVIFTVNLH